MPVFRRRIHVHVLFHRRSLISLPLLFVLEFAVNISYVHITHFGQLLPPFLAYYYLFY